MGTRQERLLSDLLISGFHGISIVESTQGAETIAARGGGTLLMSRYVLE